MACSFARMLRSISSCAKHRNNIRVAGPYTIPKTHLSSTVHRRGDNIAKFSTNSQNEHTNGDETLSEKVVRLSEQFSEARELLDDAMNSKDSVYFNDDMENASQALDQLLKEYSSLIRSLSEEQRHPVKEKFDDRMEELKSHRKSIIDSLRDL